jgi:HSP20 family protein
MTFKDYRDVIHQMEREMQQLTEEMFRGYIDLPVSGGRFWTPPVDIYETEDNLLVKCEISGVKAEDLQVSLSPGDRVLTIGGMRMELPDERVGRQRCHQLEIYFGPFERSIQLPQGVPVDREGLSAIYKDGFLVVMLPKLSEKREANSRTIPILDNGETAIDEAELEKSASDVKNVESEEGADA